MKYQKVHSRPRGTIETFAEDSSVAASISGMTIANMVASVTSGSSASIVLQSYNPADEVLYYQVSFADPGTSILKTTTIYTGSAETTVTMYKFRTLDDGRGNIYGYQ